MNPPKIKQLWDMLPDNMNEALDVFEIADRLGWAVSTTRYGLTSLILLGMVHRFPVYSSPGDRGKYCMYKYYRVGTWNISDADIRSAKTRKNIKPRMLFL